MRMLRDRLTTDTVPARVRSTGISVADVIDRMRGGEPAAALAASTGLTAPDLIAAITGSALGADDSLGPTLVQTEPPFPWMERALSDPSLSLLFPDAGHVARLAVAAGLLQIHDFWDASHNAAQQADDLGEKRVSAYWHGIAHRREPDAGNAAYWFRRVGDHPIHRALANEARPLLEAHGDHGLCRRLIATESWNSAAMIDLSTRAQPGTPDHDIARRLQRLEMYLLLEATLEGL